MYFIMTKKDEQTIANTNFLDVAEMIAANFTEDCVIRWSTWTGDKAEGRKFNET